MNVEEALRERRSTRSYSGKDVKHETLMKILSLTRYTPSSGNIQNWKFVVVRDEDKRRGIARACLNQKWMLQAPVHVVICNDVVVARRAYGDRGEKLYGIQNCAAAAQSLMLAAQSFGVSSCWVGSFDADGIRTILGIPASVNPEVIVTLGYRTEKQTSMAGRHDLSHLIFFEGWGKHRISEERLSVENLAKKGVGVVEKIKKAVKRA